MSASESLKSFVSTVCRGMVTFEETADEGQRRMRKILLESGGTGGGGGGGASYYIAIESLATLSPEVM